MWPNPQFPTDLILFTKEFINVKLHFLCSKKDAGYVFPGDNFSKNSPNHYSPVLLFYTLWKHQKT